MSRLLCLNSLKLKIAEIYHAYPQSRQRSVTPPLRCMVGHSSGHGYKSVILLDQEQRVILVLSCVNVHMQKWHLQIYLGRYALGGF